MKNAVVVAKSSVCMRERERLTTTSIFLPRLCAHFYRHFWIKSNPAYALDPTKPSSFQCFDTHHSRLTSTVAGCVHIDLLLLRIVVVVRTENCYPTTCGVGGNPLIVLHLWYRSGHVFHVPQNALEHFYVYIAAQGLLCALWKQTLFSAF